MWGLPPGYTHTLSSLVDVYRRFDEFSNFPTKFGQIRPNERNVGRPKFMRGINSLRCALRRGLRAHLRTSTDSGEGDGGGWRRIAGTIGRRWWRVRLYTTGPGVVRVRWIQSSVNCLAARPAILSGLDYKVFHSELIASRHLRAVGGAAAPSRGWDGIGGGSARQSSRISRRLPCSYSTVLKRFFASPGEGKSATPALN